MGKKSRILSLKILWARSIAISLSIFMIGYSLGVVNTLGTTFIKNFNWNNEETSIMATNIFHNNCFI